MNDKSSRDLLDQAPSDIIREALSRPSIFKDEQPLSLEFVPQKLPHRESQLRSLTEYFRSVINKPGTTSPRVLVTGDIGTGKTALTRRFGTEISRTARSLKVNMVYQPVNCREHRGSLFMILKQVIQSLSPKFPQRGFSSDELLLALLDQLEEKKLYMILALDEAESLIQAEGSTSLYNLTRLQEERPGRQARLSLIVIVRDVKFLEELDKSTQSTLQRNIIRLEHYSDRQLEDILRERIELSFNEGTVPESLVGFIADIASRRGDARYAIELLWRAGKYADGSGVGELTPDHVRTAASDVYPVLRTEYAQYWNTHEKLILLALAGVLERSGEAYATMGEVEVAYKIACEQYKETARAHTQVWKYVQNLAVTGVISATPSNEGYRGKTTLLGLINASADATRRGLESMLKAESNKATVPASR
ncbi:MAG TPA: ORC1-type DNA replication protein [Candidatus Binatus sp.]|nr:ORC1-type DNA replication protein [Candidatus Binatus sp.]